MAEQVLKGLDKVMSNLNKEINGIANRTVGGLIVASIIVQRATEKESPKTPVEFGNLRSSFFRVATDQSVGGSKGNFKGKDAGKMAADHQSAISEMKSELATKRFPMLVMGFSADYAKWVHENMEAKFQRPGAGPKFFEEAINRNKPLMIQAIRDYIKID
jgi:hypothetical protein